MEAELFAQAPAELLQKVAVIDTPERLIELANEQGGADNVTVIVIRLGEAPKGWFSWLRRGTRKEAESNGATGGT